MTKIVIIRESSDFKVKKQNRFETVLLKLSNNYELYLTI